MPSIGERLKAAGNALKRKEQPKGPFQTDGANASASTFVIGGLTQEMTQKPDGQTIKDTGAIVFGMSGAFGDTQTAAASMGPVSAQILGATTEGKGAVALGSGFITRDLTRKTDGSPPEVHAAALGGFLTAARGTGADINTAATALFAEGHAGHNTDKPLTAVTAMVGLGTQDVTPDGNGGMQVSRNFIGLGLTRGTGDSASAGAAGISANAGPNENLPRKPDKKK